jgi:hypothetical protein
LLSQEPGLKIKIEEEVKQDEPIAVEVQKPA